MEPEPRLPITSLEREDLILAHLEVQTRILARLEALVDQITKLPMVRAALAARRIKV